MCVVVFFSLQNSPRPTVSRSDLVLDTRNLRFSTGKTGPSTQLTRGMAKDKAVQLVREYFSKATPPALAAKPVAIVVQEERRYDLGKTSVPIEIVIRSFAILY